VHRAAQQALRGLLASPEVAAQRVGLHALQSLLQAAAAPAAPPAVTACAHAYTCALAPDVAPLLLRATAPAATDKAAAVKVLLLLTLTLTLTLAPTPTPTLTLTPTPDP
jgi:hypothetical protein